SPVVSAAACAALEAVEPVPVPDDDLPPEDLRDERAVRVALLAHPEVGDDPHRRPLRRAEQAERHGQLLAVRRDHAPLLLLACVQRQLRRVGRVPLEPELPLHLVQHLVDVVRPRVRPVLRHEPVRRAVHLDGAVPGGLREAPVHRLRPARRGGVPVVGPGVHVGEDYVVAGVGGAEALQLLQRALGELQVAVDAARVEQAPPRRVRRPRGHAPDERARVVQPPRSRHEVHHAAVVLRVGCQLVLQPHPVEAAEPFLEEAGAAAGVQHADVHGGVGPVALPDHRVEHLQRLTPVAVQCQAGHHGAVRPRVLVVHRVEHRRRVLDAAALGVHVHQGRA
ncbi:Os02g0697550, partial [Oryza sativa Japonica Group]